MYPKRTEVKGSSCLHNKVMVFSLPLFWSLKPALELLKINHYKAPRDKLICVLNCCKVIFGPKYPLPYLPWFCSLLLCFLVVRFRLTKASPQRGGSGCFLTRFDLRGLESESRSSAVKRRVSPFAWMRPAPLTLLPRFINRFRNPVKLQSEAGYYLSSLVCIFFFCLPE